MIGDTRSRAVAVLGLAPDATPADAGRAFLAALPATGFAPCGDRVMSLNVLTGNSLPTDPDTDTDLRAEVDDFAHRFWTLTPAERAAEGEALQHRVPHGATGATERLATILAGVDISTEPLTDSTAQEVAVLVRELFVLPPRERAIRRNEWLLTNAARHKELIHAAAEARKERPALAALELTLFARLSKDFDAVVFSENASANTRPEPRETRPPFQDPTNVERAQQASSRPKENTGSSNPSPWWLIFGAFIVLRILFAFGSSSSSTNSPKMPDYKMPSDWQGKSLILRGGKLDVAQRFVFTAAEIEAFREFATARTLIEPSRYTEWILSGSPEAKKPGDTGIFPATPTTRFAFTAEEVVAFKSIATHPPSPAPRRYIEWLLAGRPEANQPMQGGLPRISPPTKR